MAEIDEAIEAAKALTAALTAATEAMRMLAEQCRAVLEAHAGIDP